MSQDIVGPGEESYVTPQFSNNHTRKWKLETYPNNNINQR